MPGGPERQKLTISLSFLDSSAYRAILVSDDANEPVEIKIEHVELTSADSLQIELAEGGGFIGRFSPGEVPVSAIRRSQE